MGPRKKNPGPYWSVSQYLSIHHMCMPFQKEKRKKEAGGAEGGEYFEEIMAESLS